MALCEPATAEADAHWAFAINRIKAGVLPSGLARWPVSVEPSEAVCSNVAASSSQGAPRSAAAGTQLAGYRQPTSPEENRARRKYCIEVGRQGRRPVEFHSWLAHRREAAERLVSPSQHG